MVRIGGSRSETSKSLSDVGVQALTCEKLGPSINWCHMHTSKASRKTSGFHSEKIAKAKKNEGSPNVRQVAYPKKAVGSQAELNMGGAATPLVFSRDIWLNCISGPHLREYIMAVLW